MVDTSIEVLSLNLEGAVRISMTNNDNNCNQLSLVSHHDANLDLDTYYKEMSDKCDYLTLQDAIINGRDDRQDIITIRNLPENMKSTLFYGKQEMIECSQEKLKARHPFEEEAKKFPKLMNIVAKREDQSEPRINLAKILAEQSGHALAIAKAGQTSMYTANILFKQMNPIFDESCQLGAQKVTMDHKALDLLKEADTKSRQRQTRLQECKIDEAEHLLHSAMDCIDMSVLTAEQNMIQSQESYLKFCEDKTYNTVSQIQKEVNQIVDQEQNDLRTIQKHCKDDILRSDKAFDTMEQVYQDSIIHHRKMDEDLASKLSQNKVNQDLLQEKLRILKEDAKLNEQQRSHADKQQRSADNEYQNSRLKIENWITHVKHLEGQSKYALEVLEIAKKCSNMVMSDYYEAYNQHMSNLNQLSFDTLLTYRKSLSIRIVACRLRIEELNTNIKEIENSLQPKREELKGFIRTGLKVMADDKQKQVLELGQVKNNYKLQHNKIISMLEQSQAQIIQIETTIHEKFKDVALESIDDLFEEQKRELNDQWDNLELNSLTMQFDP